MNRQFPISLSRVRGHSDEKPWHALQDLKGLKLSRDATYTVWCDRMAQKAWESGKSSHVDPKVLPGEQWAVYSRHPTFHKITGNFDNGIYSSFGYSALSTYLHQKDNLSPEKIDRINIDALQNYLSSLKIHTRASVIKMIHNWIPTFGMLSQQGRESSLFCPRCLNVIKTCDHIYKCSHPQALTNRCSFLQVFLSTLLSVKTPIYILSSFE
jgi:hypothetical protein